MVYNPGLENKAADALSRMTPTIHINHISAPALLDLAKIQEEVDKDQQLQEIKKKKIEGKQDEVPNFSLQQGVLKYKGRLVLSKNLVLLPTILHTYHDSVFGGHSRFLRTYKRMTGKYIGKG